MKLSREQLIEWLDYDPDTGVFRWRKHASDKMRAGMVAGSLLRGYRQIKVCKVRYPAHRLAWLFVHGEWPGPHPWRQIDHINGDPSDNRIANLRLATPSQNTWNARKPKNNTTGHSGVFKDRRSLRWSARMMVNKRFVYLGTFLTREEAYAVWKAKARELRGPYFRNHDDELPTQEQR